MNRILSGVGGLLIVSSLGCSQYGVDELSVDSTTSALVGPEGDLDDFPWWIWPYIRTARTFTHAFGGQLEFQEARAALKQSTEQMACAAASGGTLAAAIEGIDVAFDAQFASLRLARAQAARKAPEPQRSLASQGFAFDEPEFCGTRVPPFPWPPRRGWTDLIELQADVLADALPSQLKLNHEELAFLHEHLDAQVERFRSLEAGK